MASIKDNDDMPKQQHPTLPLLVQLKIMDLPILSDHVNDDLVPFIPGTTFNLATVCRRWFDHIAAITNHLDVTRDQSYRAILHLRKDPRPWSLQFPSIHFNLELGSSRDLYQSHLLHYKDVVRASAIHLTSKADISDIRFILTHPNIYPFIERMTIRITEYIDICYEDVESFVSQLVSALEQNNTITWFHFNIFDYMSKTESKHLGGMLKSMAKRNNLRTLIWDGQDEFVDIDNVIPLLVNLESLQMLEVRHCAMLVDPKRVEQQAGLLVNNMYRGRPKQFALDMTKYDVETKEDVQFVGYVHSKLLTMYKVQSESTIKQYDYDHNEQGSVSKLTMVSNDNQSTVVFERGNDESSGEYWFSLRYIRNERMDE
ncbi:hypothetical protein SAMD00019534_002500 [Acytostelium subglobosum LB1]|uniref:hypothetical protein n=1 Tax=Acytostelium subglobosum LB1 TaxID=1410327 RepID=UPI000644FD1D|nr:hypothetical protein SAMD00019534_002500 [Acytostelium subglobosum LB1]GAM17075.1 hypothetical protein SAMD00019534_002500 [Acytostelium subglobosum LB1]|eukprot:XP_012759137.1 hypothetical protein SAMD00019534_002500 [Acytostelium subglobosum LB1]